MPPVAHSSESKESSAWAIAGTVSDAAKITAVAMVFIVDYPWGYAWINLLSLYQYASSALIALWWVSSQCPPCSTSMIGPGGIHR